ncbi:leucine--tRNA ligase [Serinibacter arcticus]|uniref:Leucine--tRNA ligase n=1 Tax=Serinibacter arcticus TaxID=1655435 RepID=A0A2U1ZR55_9MICO|nr:leucine--tRNA ligase [Serinibacter arcticus]PWD49456.1 leucine--tRNA ligase [Serinibacter arcticus]
MTEQAEQVAHAADTTGQTAATDVPPFRYTPALANDIELAWQERWQAEGAYVTPNPGDDDETAGSAVPGESFFVMDMFPYPSGKGLHVGHPLGYIATDVTGRFERMRGKNVLHALGYDAFGLPAEQYAVQTGQHPAITTEQNIAVMRRQLRRLGLGHDDSRSFATTDPEFVRWTQWIFLQIFHSWFDPEATAPDGSAGAARPVSELVDSFASGGRELPGAFAGRDWDDLTPREREDVLASYRLAFVADVPVNWCPGLGTVLANEEVTADGRSERGNFPVFKRNLRQWVMRITAYADRLVADLDELDWPEKVKSMQRHWIGRSEGAFVDFDVAGASEKLTVFTTRPDTLFGATYVVLAPEHPLVEELLTGDPVWDDGVSATWTGGAATPAEAVRAYVATAAAKTAEERQADAGAKTGVFTGGYATNPVNGEPLPIFVADYVLMGYGTGAIMAVPGHDTRDHAFATAYDLPIREVVSGAPDGVTEAAWTGDGVAVASANASVSLDGLAVAEAKHAIIEWLEAKGEGRGTTTYRLRDWLFSRQRYWGEPFPVVYDAEDGRVIPVPESMLPVALPEVADFSPRTFAVDDADSEPESPLSRATEWSTVELDLGEGVRSYRRDTNTMPNWAGSCWYYLRYLDPTNVDFAVAPELERYWMSPQPGGPRGTTGGVDLYVGGVEHAVLHLLYSRFWHKVLFDLGVVTSREPFHKLFNQGYIQAYAYTDARGVYVTADEVVEHPGVGGAEPTFTWNGEPVNREYGKMGKSLKNMVTPDDMYASYGADTFRVYEMSMGPLDQSRAWETRAVVGAQRFLQRLWRTVVDETTGEVVVVDGAGSEETRRAVARTIADVTVEYAAMRPNTAIAKLITLTNHLTALPEVPREAAEVLVLMTAPVAPHIAEELWQRLGHTTSLVHHAFPTADAALLVEDTVTCIVQVAGKVRDRLEVPVDVDPAELETLALATPGVQRILDGATPRKVIVRAPKLVNVVP